MQTMKVKETAFSAALVKAGYDSAFDRLAVEASNLLAKCDNDPSRAIGRFEEMLDSDRELRRAVALVYLKDRADDMRGETLTPVHGPNESLTRLGRRQHDIEASGDKPDGEVQPRVDGHSSNGFPDENSADRSIPLASSRMNIGRSAEPASLERIELTAIRDTAGRFSPVPSQIQKAAALRAASGVFASLFDTYKLVDGISVGDVHAFEIRRRIKKGTCDVSLLKMIDAHGVPPDNRMRVRDFISESELKRMVKEASEMSDAA